MLIYTQLVLYGLLYNEISLNKPISFIKFNFDRPGFHGQLSVKFRLIRNIIHSSEIQN